MKFLVNRIEQSKKVFYDTWDLAFEDDLQDKQVCYSSLLAGIEVVVNNISFQIDFEEELIENENYLKSFS